MASYSKLRTKQTAKPSTRARPKPSGMLTSIEINGFRGFERLQIPNLAPVTIFTGMNGAGKTTALEAILALHGRSNPTWVPNLQAHHGFAKYPSSGPNYLGLFYGFHDSGSATIDGRFATGGRCKLVLERSASSSQGQVPATARSSTGVDAPIPDLICKTFEGSKLIRETALVWTFNPPQLPQLTVRGGRDPERRAVLVHPSGQAAGEEEIARFGDARAAGRTGRIVDAMRLLNERIEDIEYLRTTTAEYFAATIDGIPRPLGLLGAGINHIFRFLVALEHVRGGCLAIDEAENGIHHSALERVFKAIIQCALEDETQLVISTHSAEALDAIGRACQGTPRNTLSVVHLEREKGDSLNSVRHVGCWWGSAVSITMRDGRACGEEWDTLRGVQVVGERWGPTMCAA